MSRLTHQLIAYSLSLALAACSEGVGHHVADGATVDLGPDWGLLKKPDFRFDGGRGDGSQRDLALADGLQRDGQAGDGGVSDATRTDLGFTRDATVDQSLPRDSRPPDSGSPTGLTKPCSKGPGFTVFRFHFDSGSTSARIDVWDASCSYSLAPTSACNVVPVYPGFGSISYTSAGHPIVTTSHYLRARFSVAGLRFSKAAVYFQGYGYSGSPKARLWSPLYGDAQSDYVKFSSSAWYGVDWSNYLSPSDKPSLTAIQIYSTTGSLAVQTVELCVEY